MFATPTLESALDPSSLRPVLLQHSFFPNCILSKPHPFNPMLSSYLASPPFLAFLFGTACRRNILAECFMPLQTF